MGGLLQDIIYSFKIHFKSPGITIATILTVALGIGASTAVFSVINAILLKPLPYPEPENIVIPWRLPPSTLTLGYSVIPWGRLAVLFITQENKSFESVGAFKGDSFNLTGVPVPVHLNGLRVSHGFFKALATGASLGRTFNVEEDQPGHDHEVILSHQLWQEQFSGDLGILGKTIDLNGSSYTVVGVMPADFTFSYADQMPGIFNLPHSVQLWIPLALPPGPAMHGELSELAIICRLKRGVNIRQAQSEMEILGDRIEAALPQFKGWYHSRLVPLEYQVTGETRRPLLLILATVGIVLLIACANVANLLLTRLSGRRRELTLRMALGAKRSRLLQQLLTESLMLSLCAGILGVLLAKITLSAVKLFGPSDIPRLNEVTLDLRVFAFAIFLTLLVGVFFGLTPAFRATRFDLVDSLKEEGQRASTSLNITHMRKTVLTFQIAFALVLAIASGLLTRSFLRLLRVDLGFDPESVMTFELSLSPVKYKEHTRIVALYQNVLQQLNAQSTTLAVGLVEVVPMGGATEATALRIPGWTTANPTERPFANYTIASPGYFAAVGMPILRGRDLLESDTESSMPVAIINAAMAEKYWPGQDAIGKQVGTPTSQDMATIIGIVPNVKHLSLRDPADPEMYVPYTQKVYPSMLTMDIALRARTDPDSTIKGIEQAVHRADPDLPIAKVATLTSLVSNSIAQQKFSVYLIAIFGIIAAGLSSIGVYAIISQSIVQRTQEIGIRLALGAHPRDIQLMILRQGARLASIGIGIGVATAFGVSRLIAKFLYGIHASDPLVFAGMTLLLTTIILFACCLPTWRAMRIDPGIILRCE